MAYSKNFPRTVEGSNYPRWEEVYLSEEEERQAEERCRQDNLQMMNECIEDAKKLMGERELKNYQSDLIKMAVALFEKRASFTVHYKEQRAKEKFDEKFKKG